MAEDLIIENSNKPKPSELQRFEIKDSESFDTRDDNEGNALGKFWG
jgi:hypothetical protein